MADLPEEVREFFRKLGRKTAEALTPTQREQRASKAGSASAEALTPEQRKERASAAAKARWAKKRAAEGAAKKSAKKPDK